MSDRPENPADRLEGKILAGGWKVGKLQVRRPEATGGHFSQSYRVVTEDGREAFLKAVDFYRAFSSSSDFTKVVQQVLEQFNFEKAMLNFCQERRMDRVVRAIGSGTVDTDGTPLGQVPYLIFEAADCDIRCQMDRASNQNELAWKLRALHHITTGLKQLHGSDVVHQDLKPSNVLVFNADRENQTSKLGDLGRASRSNTHCPFDELTWAGDMNYAPPEVFYSFYEADWHKRRIASDMYLLGSLISFLMLRTTANSALFYFLPREFWPGNWEGNFDEVLPYLENAFASVCEEFSNSLSKALVDDLLPIYRYLCDPDPRRRGYPGQKMNKISLERFVTRFDVMARKAIIAKYER